MVKNTTEFFATNLRDAIAHCVARARKFEPDCELFGFGRNDAADELVRSTITDTYSAVYASLSAPPEWVGTHGATIALHDATAIHAGRAAFSRALTNSTFPGRDATWLFEYLFGLPDFQTPASSPTPEDILAARKTAGLTQAAAAGLVYSKMRTWQDWEAGIANMHPGLWELFAIKARPTAHSPTAG